MNYKIAVIFVFIFFMTFFPITSSARECNKSDYKADFRCDHNWNYQFNLGYEFASINDIFEKGFPRTGLQIYRAFVKKAKDGAGFHGVDFFANFQLTSSAETAVAPIASSSTSEGGEKALEGDIQLFIPSYKGNAYLLRDDKNKKEYIGPMIAIGGRKSDNRDDVEGRYYGGIRAALDRDWYFDALVGHTEGLNSARVELRGQMPIMKITVIESSKLYLGAIGNFGVTSDNGKGNDVIRVYISWGIDPGKIFSIFAPSE